MTVDPREELRSLVRSARALVEAHRQAGTFGFPRGARPSKEGEREPARSEGRREAPSRDVPGTVAKTEPVVAASHEGDRRLRLGALADRVRGCTRCVLHETRTQTVFARGNPDAELCFVGEGPGADEDAQGLPFVGKAGQLLDRMIVAMGFDPQDVYVCNIVKCRPPNNRKPEREEMGACMPFLHEQIGLVSPKVIVALGATAAEGLLDAPIAITRARGEWRLYRGTIPVMPTFHPAYLLRTPGAKREVWQDLQAVLEKLGRKPPPRSAS